MPPMPPTRVGSELALPRIVNGTATNTKLPRPHNTLALVRTRRTVPAPANSSHMVPFWAHMALSRSGVYDTGTVARGTGENTPTGCGASGVQRLRLRVVARRWVRPGRGVCQQQLAWRSHTTGTAMPGPGEAWYTAHSSHHNGRHLVYTPRVHFVELRAGFAL